MINSCDPDTNGARNEVLPRSGEVADKLLADLEGLLAWLHTLPITNLDPKPTQTKQTPKETDTTKP